MLGAECNGAEEQGLQYFESECHARGASGANVKLRQEVMTACSGDEGGSIGGKGPLCAATSGIHCGEKATPRAVAPAFELGSTMLAGGTAGCSSAAREFVGPFRPSEATLELPSFTNDARPALLSLMLDAAAFSCRLFSCAEGSVMTAKATAATPRRKMVRKLTA